MAWDDGLDKRSVVYEIAASPNGTIHLLAGPGTGKSTALKRRVARLLEERTAPESILAVTFTRTAAADLLNDLHTLQIPGCDRIAACTLHSLCFQILSHQAVLRGLGRVPRFLMEFEERPLLRDIDDRRYGDVSSRQKLLRAYEAAWARLQHDDPGYPEDPVERAFQQELRIWLDFHECMLLGELVPETLAHLRDNPLSPVLKRFSHVLVDEYQDLNRADQETIDLLADTAGLLVVGDDDQSVYCSMRHANPEGIVLFPQLHQGVLSRTLDECHRCPRRVVSIANALISNGPRLSNRTLQPRQDKDAGEIDVLQWRTADEEAQGLAKIIEWYVGSQGIRPGDVLVLTPRRKIGYRIRDELRLLGLDASSYFQEESLEGDVGKERFEILALLAHPTDGPALRHLLGMDHPTCRTTQYARVRDHCEQTGLGPWEVLERLADGRLRMPHTQSLVERFRAIKEEVTALREVNREDFVGSWLGNLDEGADLRSFTEEVIGSDDIAPLLDEWIPGPVGDNPLFLGKLYQELHSRITHPEIPNDADVVRVMTLHKSKGLKADLVVVAGCIDGWIPRVDERMTIAQRNTQINECRRLFYVAVTRTTRRLILSSAMYLPRREARASFARLVNARTGRVRESRFLRELGPERPRQAMAGTDFLQRLGQIQ